MRMHQLLVAATAAAVACLFAPLAHATIEGRRFVRFDDEDPVWMTEQQIDAKVHGADTPWVNFQDLTDHPDLAYEENRLSPLRAPSPLPTNPAQQSFINPILSKVSEANLARWLRHLESYHTRARNTETGIAAAHWIAEEFQRIANAAGRTDVQIKLYDHANWRQPSVMVMVPGTLPAAEDEIVIVGAHLDSISGNGSPTNRAPGADDDASGLVAAMEAFRVLMESGFKPKRSVHFHAYAAEENGLLGSTDMVAGFFQNGRVPVYAMLQSEMNGYNVVSQVTVITDSMTHPPLTTFVGKLVNAYTSYKHNTATVCGSCSDHVSFHRAGYRVAAVAEDGPYGYLNPHYHKSTDLMQYLSLEQIAQFSKVEIAFAVELSMA